MYELQSVPLHLLDKPSTYLSNVIPQLQIVEIHRDFAVGFNRNGKRGLKFVPLQGPTGSGKKSKNLLRHDPMTRWRIFLQIIEDLSVSGNSQCHSNTVIAICNSRLSQFTRDGL